MKTTFKVFYIFYSLTFLFIYSSCSEQKNKEKENKLSNSNDSLSQKKNVIQKKYDHTLNDIANLIAGLPADTGSALKEFCVKDSVWKSYSLSNNKEWEKLFAKRLNSMKTWSEKELKTNDDSLANLFYPFSGPDILHATTFFPNSKNYYLFALEKCGSLPNLASMNDTTIHNYLNSVTISLKDIFNKSYFITNKMTHDLSKNNVNGVLPLICLLLVRTHHTILDLNYYHLNEDGSFSTTRYDSLKSFVKVDFKSNDNENIQTVYYFRANLENKALEKNKGLQVFLNGISNCKTYLKSASYLLHYTTFSKIRNLILTNSNTVLEDDTGVPFSYFETKKWKVQLYGKYNFVTRDFKGVFQKDLQLQYQNDTSRKSLPFSLGYHWGDKNQNLLKATKKN